MKSKFEVYYIGYRRGEIAREIEALSTIVRTGQDERRRAATRKQT